jgi:hypothetical protein
MEILAHLWSYLARMFFEWGTLQTNVVEKIKTHILCSIMFFFEKHVIYEVKWKIMVEADRLQMAV